MKNQAKILLFIVLFSYTPLREFLRLPYVLIHFAYHNEEGDVMSFSDFVLMHYLEKSVPDEDHPQDMQLPFKSLTENCLSQNAFQVPCHRIHLQFKTKQPGSYSSGFNFFAFKTSPHLRGVFHPPQSIA